MLTSLQNPLVKQIRKLHQGKHRRRQQQFLLEGTHLLEVASTAAWPLDVVCCTPEWQQKNAEMWAQIQDNSPRTELVSADILASIATTVHPDGVVAVARSQPQSSPRMTNLGLVLERNSGPW